jgi:hypothetical protein
MRHSPTEEAILVHLYEHPEAAHSTDTLVAAIPGDSLTTVEIADELLQAMGKQKEPSKEREPRPRQPSEVQSDIESLLVKGLIHGKRVGTPGNIRHTNIRLTKKGEVEAIRAKVPVARITVDL